MSDVFSLKSSSLVSILSLFLNSSIFERFASDWIENLSSVVSPTSRLSGTLRGVIKISFAWSSSSHAVNVPITAIKAAAIIYFDVFHSCQIL